MSAILAGSAAQVAASTTPVCLSLYLLCQALTAAAVFGPKSPSGVVFKACCNVMTAGPSDPRPMAAQVTIGGDALDALAAVDEFIASAARSPSVTIPPRCRGHPTSRPPRPCLVMK